MPADPGLRRLDQGMAAEAAWAVPATVDRETLTRLRQLPVMLHNAGLAASLAYLVAKSRTNGTPTGLEAAYEQVARALTGRIVDRLRLQPAPSSPADLVKRLAGLEIADYQLASREAQAFAGWLRRIAEGRPAPAGSAGSRASAGSGAGGGPDPGPAGPA